ncbi:MAG: DUF3095 domain-containing protein [Candidatus Kapabacteria bacterium]|jgi:hypothetical protein|nr:DUF3095 domain-containing protein [Candidatus Kapabacteria bacterium]
MPTSQDFYKRLTPIENFLAIADAGAYQALPNDWLVVITDVVNSTEAIEAGKYKDVNTAGGLAAIAVANALGGVEFPFVFGGDGVTILIPATERKQALDALAGTRALCRTMFGLELRVGIVPMTILQERGASVYLAKLRLSEKAQQAIMIGQGIEIAEALVKDAQIADTYLLPEDYRPEAEADFKGYICSWLDIPSPRGETVSLIVKILDPSIERTESRLRDILQTIHRLCGTETEHHPLSLANLAVSASLDSVRRNALVLHHAKKDFSYWWDFLTILLRDAALRLIPRSQSDFARTSIMNDADFRKFDGALKMVISCTTESRKSLVAYLETLAAEKNIAFGIHVADRAIMTCLLQSPTGHIHFIDAADGGYTLAAKQLKQQLKALQAQ